MKKNLVITETIQKYLEKFPKSPSKTLARKIYNENKELFMNEESVYLRVRYKRGAAGSKSRKSLKDKTFVKDTGIKVIMPELPESFIKQDTVYNIPTGIKKLGIMGDIHLPYHDINAVKTCLNTFEKEEVDAIFINGDLLDFYQLSFYEKDPRKVRFKDEIAAGKKFFDHIRARFPKIPIYFIPGNHEIRLERYLKVKASELLDMDEFRLDVLLELRSKGIIYLEHKTTVNYGDYIIEHGDKIPGGGGVIPARTAIMRFKRNVIINHFHKTSETSQNIYGKNESISAYSLGCLCELNADYLPLNDWNHGFAIMSKNSKNEVSVRNYRLINGVLK